MTTETLIKGWALLATGKKYHHFVELGRSACGKRSRGRGPLQKSPGLEGTCKPCLRKVRETEDVEPIWLPDAPGFTFFPSRGSTRLEMECQHQHGLLYVTEGAEMNWVCSSRRRPAHSLAGFFRELGEMQDARVREVMQRWGLCYRQLPLAQQPTEEEEEERTVDTTS